jgi:hypothetical protein
VVRMRQKCPSNQLATSTKNKFLRARFFNKKSRFTAHQFGRAHSTSPLRKLTQ